MTKINIISGFLGAGKTTLIKKLLDEKAFGNDKLVLIENEFGEIGIDGTILKKYGIEIKEMNSGCICCTISGDFSQALKEMIKLYQPDRIIIEPSGVGKLSDVIKGCNQLMKENTVEINIIMTVIDGMKYEVYMKNFAEFYKDQLVKAKVIILSRTQNMKPETLDYIINDIRKYNKTASLITTEWDRLTGTEIIQLSEEIGDYNLEYSMRKELKALQRANRVNKKTDLKITGSVRKEHHHADEVFTVWSKETARVFDYYRLKDILKKLDRVHGVVLRAKGIVKTNENRWIQFDYVPGESKIKEIEVDFVGKVCVIGEQINSQELSELFDI